MPNIQPMSLELQAFLTCPMFLLPLAWVGWAFCATPSDVIAASVEKVETGTRGVAEAWRTMKDVVTKASQISLPSH